MTLTLDLPADLQEALLSRASVSGSNVEEMIVNLLRDGVCPLGSSQGSPISVQRLKPGVFPEEIVVDDSTYQSLPLSPVGVVTAHLIPAGQLVPATFLDTE
jgi:hypothetical protein